MRLCFSSRFLVEEVCVGFSWCDSAALWQEYEYKEEACDTDTSIEEEGSAEPSVVLHILEGLEDDEPAEVGCDVGEGEGPCPAGGGEELCGEEPGEAGQAQAVGGREAHEEGQGQPGAGGA